MRIASGPFKLSSGMENPSSLSERDGNARFSGKRRLGVAPRRQNGSRGGAREEKGRWCVTQSVANRSQLEFPCSK
jgi:hypothetical protein